MGFGFVIARLGLFLRELAAVHPQAVPAHPGLSLWLGTALVVMGAGVNLVAGLAHGRSLRRLARGEPWRGGPAWGPALALVLAGFGLVLAGYLLVF